jgi:hypothetical protein
MESRAKALARQEGWNVHDLLNCESYGSLHRRKTSMLEEVTLCGAWTRSFLPNMGSTCCHSFRLPSNQTAC